MGHGGTVAHHDFDVVHAHPEFVCNDLCQGGFETLAVGRDAEYCGYAAGRVDTDRGAFRPGVDRHSGRS